VPSSRPARRVTRLAALERPTSRRDGRAGELIDDADVGRPGVREAQPHRLESSHERLNVVRIHEPDSEKVGFCTERLIGAVTLEPFSAAWIHGLNSLAEDDHAQRFGEDAHRIISTRSRSLVLAVAG
jgi:hypothetical protein